MTDISQLISFVFFYLILFSFFFALLLEEKKKKKFNPPRFTVCSPSPPRNIFSFRFCAPPFPRQEKNSEKKYPPTEGERNQTTTKTQKYNPYPKTKTLMIKLHSTKNTEKLFESYATRGKHQSPSVPDTPVRTVT